MGSYGPLIPDTYVREIPNEVDMNTASIFWGFSLGVAVFSAGKAGKQTWRSWKRVKRVTAYVFMLWAVFFSSMVLGVLAWGFQRQYIEPSFAFYFNVALWWALQVQFLLQIILNRIGLLIVVPGRATKLKWIVFAIILAVNISVFVIWMPARLQISPFWVRLNEIWDRCEKVIFAIVDGALNFYFIYLVRSRLITNGLTKYVPLYRMNLILIFISLSLDMAELITKIVRSTGASSSEDIYYRKSSTGPKSKSGAPAGGQKARFSSALSNGNRAFRGEQTTKVEVGDHDSDIELEVRGAEGIMKTVQTTIASSPVDDGNEDDAHSRSSSTRNLHFTQDYARE
ncbi:hypothetical protein S40288_09061 [Stachybotrys chartarum IBT 40288]|nr:hypothetical protein S40288_09061 [Stachybotrys chartarum IBT 40288]